MCLKKLSRYCYHVTLFFRKPFSSKHFASVDQRCYPDACWYCSKLCEYCMNPAKSEFKHIQEKRACAVAIEERNFCSLHCKTLCTQQDTSRLPVIAGYVHKLTSTIGELPNYTIGHITKVFDTLEGGNNVIQVSLCFGNGIDDGFGEIPLDRMFVLYHEHTLTKQVLSEFFISESHELEPFQSDTEMDKIRDNRIKSALELLLSRTRSSSVTVYQFAARALRDLSAQIVSLLPDTADACRLDGHKVLLHWTTSKCKKQKTYFLIAATDHLYLLFIEYFQTLELQIVDGVTILPDDEMEAGLKCSNFLSPGRKHYTTLSQVQDDLRKAIRNRELLERRGLNSILSLFRRIQYDR